MKIATEQDRRYAHLLIDTWKLIEPMELTAKKWSEQRNNKQNRYLFGVVYPVIKQHIFDSTGDNFTTEEIHDWNKDQFIDAVPVVINGKGVLHRTTKMPKDKFCIYVDRIKHHFAEQGLVIRYLGSWTMTLPKENTKSSTNSLSVEQTI